MQDHIRNLVFACVLFAPASLSADASLRVTIAGDSISHGLSNHDDPNMTSQQVGWWTSSKDFLGDVLPGSGGGYQIAFDDRGLDVVVRPRSFPGMSVAWYNHTSTRLGIDLAGQTLSYSANPLQTVLDSDADVILFMMGANDAKKYWENQSAWGPLYKDYFLQQLTYTFDEFAAQVNGRGKQPVVFVGNIVPFRVPPYPGTWFGQTWTQQQIDDRVAYGQVAHDEMNPVIMDLAEQYGFFTVDVCQAIDDTGDQWETYYSDWIHPSAAGRVLQRNAFLDKYEQVMAVMPGDADSDGDVDAADYIALKRNFATGSGATWQHGDFDADGDVDRDDLLILSANFGRTSAWQAAAAEASEVPEPATLSLLVLGGLALLRRRRVRASSAF